MTRQCSVRHETGTNHLVLAAELGLALAGVWQPPRHHASFVAWTVAWTRALPRVLSARRPIHRTLELFFQKRRARRKVEKIGDAVSDQIPR
jgi:hypothetical protein